MLHPSKQQSFPPPHSESGPQTCSRAGGHSSELPSMAGHSKIIAGSLGSTLGPGGPGGPGCPFGPLPPGGPGSPGPPYKGVGVKFRIFSMYQ